MSWPSGSSIGSAIESTSRSISPGGVAPSRSPSAPTALICCRAAAIAGAERVSLFVCSVVNARPRVLEPRRPRELCSAAAPQGRGRVRARISSRRRADRRAGGGQAPQTAAGARGWWSGAEAGGGAARASRRGGEAGLVPARGDLAGDRAELGGDRRLARL